MPADASIYGNSAGAPVTPVDPLAAAGKAYMLKAAKQQAQLGDMELQDQMTLRSTMGDPRARNQDGSINYGFIMQEGGGTLSPKAMMSLVAANQQQTEKKQKMEDEFKKASGPLAAGLYTKYQELAKTMGPDAAWEQVRPQAAQAMGELKQRFPQANVGNPDKLTPDVLERAAMGWDEYTKRQMRGSQPSTPHERAQEDIQRRGVAARERQAAAAEKKAAATKGFEGENGELMGALAERGVSLPTGFRSKEQQIGLLNALRKRNPGKSVDQIADMVKNGQIDLANIKKAGQVAAGIAGKVSYAEEEIKGTVPAVLEAMKKVPRGKFVPFNKIKQMGEEAFSDPDLAEYATYMTSLSNAYDMLAARGGTDKDKRAENRKLFDTAKDPEAVERILKAIEREAAISGQAAKRSIENTKGGGETPSGKDPKQRKPLSAFGGNPG